MSASAPLLPRWAIVLVTFGVLGLIGFAVYQQDWIVTAILCLVLLFILGADVGAILRAWRGTLETPPAAAPAVPPPPAGPALPGPEVEQT